MTLMAVMPVMPMSNMARFRASNRSILQRMSTLVILTPGEADTASAGAETRNMASGRADRRGGRGGRIQYSSAVWGIVIGKGKAAIGGGQAVLGDVQSLDLLLG